MSKSEEQKFDPFGPWKPFQQAWTETWSKVMNETVSSEDFAKMMGQYLDTYLEASAPIRRQVEEAMEKYLQQMSMPTRSEVIGLAERLTNLEMHVDDLDAKLNELLDRVKTIQSTIKPEESGKRG